MESGEGCRFTVLESRIFDVHLMSLLLRKMQLEASVFHFHWCLHILHSPWIFGRKWDFQHDNPRLSVMPSSSFSPIRFPSMQKESYTCFGSSPHRRSESSLLTGIKKNNPVFVELQSTDVVKDRGLMHDSPHTLA